MLLLISQEDYIKEEINRCKNSSYYFYSNYFQTDERKLTEVEYNSFVDNAELLLFNVKLKPRRPLTIERLRELFNSDIEASRRFLYGKG